jgi:hypothetical protein
MKIATFYCDITPPIGHPLCAGWYPPAASIGHPLSAWGVVIRDACGKTAVLCALDWAELSNREHYAWRAALAETAGTVPEHVAVQCTHAHDTPWPDGEAQRLLDEQGHPEVIMQHAWCEGVRRNVAESCRQAMNNMQDCTHISVGQALVDKIASNRRIMGEDGKVKGVRWTKCRDKAIRNAPEGVIDPNLKTITFWNQSARLCALHYYAVHPTSLDGVGEVTPEFVGLARDRCIKEDGFPHIYFTGCGGNITAGKYNDGVADNRELFTQRIIAAIRESEENASTAPLAAMDIKTCPIHLPPREDLNEENLLAQIADPNGDPKKKSKAALMLTYLRRKDLPITVMAVELNNDIAILNLPGEAFVEYQLYAQEIAGDTFVATASYGDLGTGYITMEKSFEEGGYEPIDAFVSPTSEPIMKDAIRTVLEK